MHETNLGTIIKNTRARQIIYAAYVLVALAVGATQAAYAVIDSQPEWLSVVLAVVAYLGVPVGGLAAANAPYSNSEPSGYVDPEIVAIELPSEALDTDTIEVGFPQDENATSGQ